MAFPELNIPISALRQIYHGPGFELQTCAIH
jgi:hypothetical protein